MRDFDDIMAAAVARKGSRDAVLALEPPGVLDAQALAATADRDWLAAMARGILAAGISWKVIEAKWDGICEAFHGFDVGRVSMLNEDDMDTLMGDTRVIRSLPKLRAIRHNAAFIREVAEEHGSFGARDRGVAR